MVWLRLTSICANLSFIAFGVGTGFAQIYLLHLILLTLNLTWLIRRYRGRERCIDGRAAFVSPFETLRERRFHVHEQKWFAQLPSQRWGTQVLR